MVVRSKYGPTYLLHVIRYSQNRHTFHILLHHPAPVQAEVVGGVRQPGDHPSTTLARHGFERQQEGLKVIVIVIIAYRSVGFPPLDVFLGFGYHTSSQIF
jgi:hypothetical protein